MNKLWKFLNSPLLVVLIALLLWPILTALTGGIAMKIGIRQMAQTVSDEVSKAFQGMGDSQDEELKKTADILNKVSITNVRAAPTSWPNKIKVVGTITNRYEDTVKSIHLLVSLYKENTLVNVDKAWLSNVKLLKPGASSNFFVTSDLEEGQDPASMRVEIKVSDIGILE